MKKEQRREMKKKGIGHFILDQERRRMNAKIIATAFAFLIIIILVAATFVVFIDKSQATTHQCVYITVENNHFVNSSGSYSFVTTVKNTGTTLITSVAVSISGGAFLGNISSTPIGGTVTDTSSVRGVMSGQLYIVEYDAVGGNSSYNTSYPVST